MMKVVRECNLRLISLAGRHLQMINKYRQSACATHEKDPTANSILFESLSEIFADFSGFAGNVEPERAGQVWKIYRQSIVFAFSVRYWLTFFSLCFCSSRMCQNVSCEQAATGKSFETLQIFHLMYQLINSSSTHIKSYHNFCSLFC